VLAEKSLEALEQERKTIGTRDLGGSLCCCLTSLVVSYGDVDFWASEVIKVVSQGRDFGLPPLLPNCARSVPKNSIDINDIPRK